MVAPHDVASAVAEARRTVTEYGFSGIYLPPGTIGRKPWHDRHWDPLWAECERLGVPVCFHGGGRTYLKPDFSLEIFADRLMMWHCFNQPLGVMTVLREPLRRRRARALPGSARWRCSRATAPGRRGCCTASTSTTSGSGWYEARDLSRKPREYFRRNCFVSVDADEETCKYTVDWFGDDNLVFSTDFPHGDSMYPHAVEGFDEVAALGCEQAQDRRRELAPPVRIALPESTLAGRETRASKIAARCW